MSPRQQRMWDWLGFGVTAVAGGVWGMLLARVLFELWPWWFPKSGLLFSTLALCGALGAPFLFYVVGLVSTGWAAARSWPLALGVAYLLQPSVEPLWGLTALISGLGGATWLFRRQNTDAARLEWLWDVLVFVVPLALYVSTLAPSVLPGDSGEFQFVAATLGIPHPTGYPLYLVLGKLFSLLPINSVAYRLNLLSAVAAAGTVWAVYRAGRALRLHRAASLLGAASLMVSEAFWSQATITEKYALNAFFVALTLWLGLQWRSERQAGRSGSGWLSAWALCYGLSLTHHRTMTLFAPAYLLLLWQTDRTVFRWRSMLRLALLVLAPLPLYLLLPLFSALDPPYAYVRIDSLQAFLDLVLARTYQSGLFRGGWAALPGRLAALGGLLARQFGPLGLVLAIFGWAALAWRRRGDAWILMAGMVAQIVFALNYYVPNTPVYYLPAYVWLATCAAVAVDAILQAIDGFEMPAWLPARTRPHLRLACVLVVAALPTALCASRWTGMDRRRAYANLAFDHTYGQMALRAVEENALLVSDWLPATVLWYAQFVENLVPSAQVAALDSLEWQWRGLVEGGLAAGRPVYLARPLVAASDHYPLTSAGPLVRVLAEPSTTPPSMAHPLDVDLDRVRLLGYGWVATAPGPEGEPYTPVDGEVAGGSTLHVTLYWQAVDVPAGDYAVTVRLVDAQGRTRLERQNRHPVGGTYPTSRWQAGEVVADAYVLTLPPRLASGEYRLQATMGVPFAEIGLRDREGSDRLSLATIVVRKPLRWPYSALSVPLRNTCWGDLVLMGYDAPRQVLPGETASVALQWLVLGNWNAFHPPEVVLAHEDGTTTVIAPFLNSLDDWQRGALVVEQFAFTVPDDFARLEVRREGSEPRSPAWTYRLPMHLTSAPPPVANFDDRIRLRNYVYAATSLKPGDTMHLTLEWEAAQTIAEPYKVFVHVLGPNGLPIAQQDNEPVNGTYPTTRWQRGEQVSDSYAIVLPTDLVPGEYPVEVGWYRISDLSRLPVLDENRVVVDDKVFLAPLVVE